MIPSKTAWAKPYLHSHTQVTYSMKMSREQGRKGSVGHHITAYQNQSCLAGWLILHSAAWISHIVNPPTHQNPPSLSDLEKSSKRRKTELLTGLMLHFQRVMQSSLTSRLTLKQLPVLELVYNPALNFPGFGQGRNDRKPFQKAVLSAYSVSLWASKWITY